MCPQPTSLLVSTEEYDNLPLIETMRLLTDNEHLYVEKISYSSSDDHRENRVLGKSR